MTHEIDVAIADADRSRRNECERLLCGLPGIRLIAHATRANDVVPMVARCRPRVLVLDLDLCREAGDELMPALHECSPRTGIVVVELAVSRDERALAALASGARAYLSSAELGNQLAAAIKGVTRGEVWVPRRMLGRVAGWLVS